MNTENDITVIVADDHRALCEGFNSIFKNCGIEIIANAFNGEELLSKVREHQPDVVLVDIKMPVMNGLEATKIIKKEFPQIKIIAFSAFNELGLIDEMTDAGADGFVIKNIDKEDLFRGIKKVHGGENYYCAVTAKTLAKRKKIEPLPENISFTIRELDVLKSICRGNTNKEIGKELGIHARTVEFHRANIYKKTCTRNLAALAIFAVKHGLI